MVTEQPPATAPGPTHREGEMGPSTKTPPLKRAVRRTEDPVGLQPLDDILMTGYRDESLVAGTDGPGQGRAADLGDRTVDDRGVFVHDSDIGRTVSQDPGQRGAELLAGRQDVKRPQPSRRPPETPPRHDPP